ncbi:hypothetical protein [Moraxella equi]|uniref:Uncharacterized protein n=2 Tax=Moraxella equi TaxID=60442 RepID=A0A378QPF8_9GAMM|nr:hypothetical protein [Moraxella equi]OPH33856.1 hypothetical protein B5J93_12435 [Moraxella equi]STZ02745.1 Uncharacterised protein [Moraxella equi]
MATISAKFPKLIGMSMLCSLLFACGGDKPASQSETVQAPRLPRTNRLPLLPSSNTLHWTLFVKARLKP